METAKISDMTNMEDMRSLAVAAFRGTSFDPEERAEQHLRGYERLLAEDLEGIPEEERGRYAEKFREWVRIVMGKRSRIMSAMIAGPARFPVARNEKANRAYGSALEAFEEWRRKEAKSAKRRAEAAKTPEQKTDEEWIRLRSEIASSIATCAEIDNGARGYYRPLFTSSIAGKVERLARNGKAELVLRALDYIRDAQENKEVGLKKPLFTSRHRIWNLREACGKAVQRKEENAAKESGGTAFEGGRVVLNHAEDRLQIIFDEKPAQEMISTLKHGGFRWSPRFGAWQRQLTQNALHACARVVPVPVEQLMG